MGLKKISSLCRLSRRESFNGNLSFACLAIQFYIMSLTPPSLHSNFSTPADLTSSATATRISNARLTCISSAFGLALTTRMA